MSADLLRLHYGGKGTRRATPYTRQRSTSRRVRFRSSNHTPVANKDKGFGSKLVCTFFELLLMVKLYHWNTYSYATHKATDELHERLSNNIDRFMEVYLGTHGGTLPSQRIATGGTTIRLVNLGDKKELTAKIAQFKSFLIGSIKPPLGPDLLTIRDEILADINQFLYLLTLH